MCGWIGRDQSIEGEVRIFCGNFCLQGGLPKFSRDIEVDKLKILDFVLLKVALDLMYKEMD
jgi:hypothetical protein